MADASSSYASFFETCLLLAVLLPLISFFVSGAISERYSWIVSFTAPLFLLISAICSIYIFFTVWQNHAYTAQWNWFSVGGTILSAGIYLNNIAALMLLVVTFISFLVHLYSTGYMAGDGSIARYFGMLGLFTFAMLGIVLANSLLLVFVFWELVGFSSYMLIGHWKEKPEASAAAKKAFIFNRIGDAGFLIGLMLLWTNTGTFDLVLLATKSEMFSWQTTASLCFFCGVMGKSAQFPLLTWLPDAMEGPTPVSALIHAATMVAAGVFLLARIDFLFTPQASDVITVIGITTALIAALSALVQADIKKILAYSTISQLGLMITAIGAGSTAAAMLHLFTHAFFKACLFLCAGNIIHALHQAQQQAHAHFNVQDIRNLGGLRKKLPLTFIAFVLSGSALSGIPLFSGFISKDAILTALVQWKDAEFSWRWLVLVAAFLVSFITVVYTFRMAWLIFMGEERATTTASLTITEPPAVMRIPVAVLAICSIWLVVSFNPIEFQGWLFNGLHTGKYFHFGFLSIASALWIILALLVAWFVCRQRSMESPLLLHAFYLDTIYSYVIGKPVLKMADLAEYFDRKWIDGLIHASAYAQVTVAHFIGWFDRAVVDGAVNGVAALSRSVGNFTRSFQGGRIQAYILWAVLAIIIFLIWTLF
ncbi:MAG TPA: NADH-quinone oxidoreductase subunit L [Ohtaekwangia sp.]|uniref:NADH-quinone oxidoreductase subunit 5 family protein n=1 Tax=Ohtaekwangia sp. TaxID=2066019 RepID=UPI002F91D65B